jgi:hypothetical protein
MIQRLGAQFRVSRDCLRGRKENSTPMIENQPTEGCTFMCGKPRKTVATLGTLALCWAVAASASTCSAATIIGPSVTLASLLNPGGNIVVGDKTFTNFTYSITGDMPAAVNVNVIGITDDSGNFGIRFQGAFMDTAASVGGSDALIEYKVTADALHLISDAHLQGNAALLGSVGSIGVTEHFFPLGQQGEYTMTIYDESVPDPQNPGMNIRLTKLVDWVDFAPPVMMLNVQKDIAALAQPGQPAVSMSFVDQTFSQIVIPEPAAGLLFLCGCLGLAVSRWRNSRVMR